MRHKGFIPWDDDVDVMMTRREYKKLIDAWKDSDKYELLCYEKKGKAYCSPLPKVVDKRTIINQFKRSENFELGLYIDIFVLDYLPENKAQEINKHVISFSMGYLTSTTKLCKCTNLVSIKDNIKRIVYKCVSPSFFVKQLERIGEKDALLSSSIMGVTNFTSYRKVYPSEIFTEITELQFGQEKFMAPAKYDEYLRITYGDYMQLPEQSKRVSNHSFEAFWKYS